MKEFLCSICERRIIKGWYCYRCYIEFRSEIEDNLPWTRYIQNLEKRRRREPTPPIVYLGDRFDITDDGHLVLREGYYGR